MDNRRLHGILIVLIALLLTPSAFALEYNRSVLNLPAQTTAFETRYDLDGDKRIDVMALFQRRILIFFQNSSGGYSVAPDVEIGAGTPIPQEYASAAVGKVADSHGLQLILIGPSGADYISIAELRQKSSQPVEPHPLVSTPVSISSSPDLQFVDAAVDLNGNGQTQLLLPASNELQIFSRSGAAYVKTGALPLALTTVQQTALREEPALMGSPYNFEMFEAASLVRPMPRLGRWHGIQFAVVRYGFPFLLADFNMDKRIDAITRDRVLYQTPDGKFQGIASPTYSRISSALALSRNRPGVTPQAGDFVVAPNLVDFNGDGRLDTFRVTSSATKLSPRTDVSIYLGREDRSIPEEPDQVLRTRDVAYSEMIPIGDINKDGALDIALFHLDFQPSSASSQLKAYMRSGLQGELRFYLWDKGKNRFPDDYAFSEPVVVNYEIYGARQLFRQQVVMNQDMDGDGYPDLVLKTGPQQISVLHNEDGKGFSTKAITHVNTSPTRFSSVIVRDLNGDKKSDIIVSGYTEQLEDRVIYSLFTSR